MNFKTDCRHFHGDVPCAPGKICENCDDYVAVKNRILLVKLGAMGDVLRTTPCLRKLRSQYEPCRLTWVVESESAPLLKHNPMVDRVVVWGPEALARVMVEEYELVVGLDKDPGAAALVTIARSQKKLGFALDTSGAITFLNKAAEYAHRLGLDDELKFRLNKKTYQEMIFDIMGLDWNMDDYELHLPPDAVSRGKSFIESVTQKGSGPIIGFNPGAGPRWPLKKWTIEGFASLADRLAEKMNARIIILGAPVDRERNSRIAELAKSPVSLANHEMDILTFAGALAALDAVVTGDTVAMHLGLAVHTPTVCIFGPTSPVEVETYGRGVKVITPLECAPCYKTQCERSPSCMELIGVETVFESLCRVLKNKDAL